MTTQTHTDDDILDDELPLGPDQLAAVSDYIENSADPLLDVTSALMAARRAHMTIAFGTNDAKITTALVRYLTTASVLIDDFLDEIDACCVMEVEEPVELESATQREPRQ